MGGGSNFQGITLAFLVVGGTATGRELLPYCTPLVATGSRSRETFFSARCANVRAVPARLPGGDERPGDRCLRSAARQRCRRLPAQGHPGVWQPIPALYLRTSSGTAITSVNTQTGSGQSFPANVFDISAVTNTKQLVRLGFFFLASSADIKVARVQARIKIKKC